MVKKMIWNVLLNLAIISLIFIGYQAYKAKNVLVVGLCIAFGVVVIYLKVVLTKHVRKLYGKGGQTASPAPKKKKK